MSHRMGRDKLLLDYNGKLILQHSVDLLCMLPVYERILITSDARVQSISIPANIAVRINSQPESGISKSIQIGVEASTGTHYLFLNADQPKLKISDLTKMIEAADANPDKIIHPEIDSKPCSPTLFPGYFRDELLYLSHDPDVNKRDAGGRTIRDANKPLCIAIVPEDPTRYIDIDNTDDYMQII